MIRYSDMTQQWKSPILVWAKTAIRCQSLHQGATADLFSRRRAMSFHEIDSGSLSMPDNAMMNNWHTQCAQDTSLQTTDEKKSLFTCLMFAKLQLKSS
jgi:hypothetical protein